jgi:hypothetical protein
VRLVRQKDPEGCAVAAFAMLMGMTYDRASHELNFDGEGLKHGRLRRELESRGKFCRTIDSREETGGHWPPPVPFAPAHFAEVHQNDTGNAHIVVVDGHGRVYDPLTPAGEKPGLFPLALWRVVQEVVGVL